MKLSIIIIGDEILLGQVTDTNSGNIARAFVADGWEVVSVVTVGDGDSEIRQAIDRAMSVSDFVVTTGGLGPTKDDITKAVMLDIFGGELREDPAVTENVKRIFERRGIRMNELTRHQVRVPTSCRVIQNLYGTAPVMWFEVPASRKVLVAMPGVPFETEGMLSVVLDEARKYFNPDLYFCHRSMMVGGISESALAERLDSFEESLAEGLHLAYLPTPGLVRLRLDGRGVDEALLKRNFDAAFERLKVEVGDNLVFDGDADAAEIVFDTLKRHGLTMATAESCTGGNIAKRITSIAGASEVFVGGVVSYSNDVKMKLLNVSAETLSAVGAVSEEVVEQMAKGVIAATGADCAVATSGIAGPGGATEGKPVGTVWTAVAIRKGDSVKVETRLLHLPGNRERVIDRATTEVLLALHRLIQTA